MPFYVVLDACVLVPMPLRDTLLRLAAEELYVPKWAGRTLTSVERIMVEELGKTPAQAERLGATMRMYFEDAEVPAEQISALEPAMGNAPSDRYVLAAAVASGAERIITDNLSDFPAEACEKHDVQAITPDEFLQDLLAHHPDVVPRALEEQAAALTAPPLSLDELLDRLERASPGVPDFVAAVRGVA